MILRAVIFLFHAPGKGLSVSTAKLIKIRQRKVHIIARQAIRKLITKDSQFSSYFEIMLIIIAINEICPSAPEIFQAQDYPKVRLNLTCLKV